MYLNSGKQIGFLVAALTFSWPAAASLNAFAGVVGGAGNGCSTFSKHPELSFFTVSLPSVPTGGITACGYSGAVSLVTAANGPLTNSETLTPVILGNPGYSGYFDGTANARVDYAALGASAHANISGGAPGSPLALFNATGAAWFSDTLTASSPLVANASAGFVRYQFSVDGSLGTPGAPAPYFFGETYMALDLQQQGGPVYEIVNAHLYRGAAATISGATPGPGWTTTVGSSLSGGGTFYSLDLPMNWGQAWDIKVGLLAWAYGTADTNFLTTAKITGVELFDSNHAPVTQFTLSALSGTDYANPVPEPQDLELMLSGLILIGFAVHRKARAAT
jgi:hypothetical protein